MFATLTDVREVLAELQGLQRGSLLVGASTTPGIYVLPAVIGEFRRRYPGIDLRLRIANSRVIEEAIRAHEVDLGVVGGHGLTPGEECLAAGLADELVLIVSPRHRWAGAARSPRPISPMSRCWSARKARRPAASPSGRSNRPGSAGACRWSSATPRPSSRRSWPASASPLSRCTPSVAKYPAGRLAAVRLRDIRIQRHFHVIHSEARTLSVGARALVAMLSERAEKRRPGR